MTQSVKSELVATWTLTREGDEHQLQLRVQDAKGKWMSRSLDRHWRPGWQELVTLLDNMAHDMAGENTLF